MSYSEIKISKNRTIIVDDEDKEKIKSNIHIVGGALSFEIRITPGRKGKRIYKRVSHAILGLDKFSIVSHKNKNIYDFRKENLIVRANTKRNLIINGNDCLIPLSNSKDHAIINAYRIDLVKNHLWRKGYNKNSLTYYAVTGNGSPTSPLIKMHRLILGITDPKIHGEHKDGNGLNNRDDNLRICTSSLNHGNRIKQHGNYTSIYKGVCLDSYNKNKYRAYIVKDKKQYQLGHYKNEIDAAKKYDKAARELFGEFACLNFPQSQERGATQ